MRKGIKVHLGAFDKAVDGWVNTDITPHLWIGRVPLLPCLLHVVGLLSTERLVQHRRGVFARLRYVNLTRPLPFADASVEAFFSSHVLEHLFLGEVEKLIAEMYRCLLPGGICRVVVPDLDKVVARYDPQNPRLFLHDIYEISCRSAVKNAHHSGYTGEFLCALFTAAGFRETVITTYGVGRCPDLKVLDNRPDSLFFEAVK